jgi:hypothetical protein
MDKILAIVVAIEPILVAAIGFAALIAVPLVVRAVMERLSVEQQRFAYDVAKGLADGLDLIDDKTPTKIDDALLKVMREIEAQLGRKLNIREQAAAKQAVVSASGRKVLPG